MQFKIYGRVKPLFLVFLGFSLILVVLRTVLKFTNIEKGLGFYQSVSPLVWTFNAIFIFAVLMLLGVGFYFGGAIDSTKIRVSTHTGFSACVCGVLLCLAQIFNVLQIINGSINNTKVHLLQYVIAVTGIGGSIALIVLGLKLMSGIRRVGQLDAVILLMPVLWQLFDLVYKLFLKYTEVSSVSDQLLSILSMTAVMLFLFAQARLVVFESSSKGIRYTIMTGYISALFGLVFAVPAVLCGIFAPKSVFDVISADNLLTIAFAVYSMFAASDMIGQKFFEG